VKIGDENDVIVYSRKNKVPYRPQIIFNPGNGSIGWKAIDLRHGIVEREVLRRDLSDRMLAILGSIE